MSGQQMSHHLSRGSKHWRQPAGMLPYLHVRIPETGTEACGDMKQTSLVGETVKILAFIDHRSQIWLKTPHD